MRLFFIVLFIGCICSPILSGQSANPDDSWRWARFTVASGLPDDRILQIVETDSGIPWVSTPSGLAWFNGFRWRPVAMPSQIPAQTAVRIFGVSGERVLLGAKFLAFVDRQTVSLLPWERTFLSVPFGPDSLLGIRNNSLFLLHADTALPFPPSREITDGKTLGIWCTYANHVWINLVDGLYWWDGKLWRREIPAVGDPLGKIQLVENRRGTGLATIEFPYRQRGIWEWAEHQQPRLVDDEKLDNIKTLDIAPNGDEAIIVYRSDELRVRRNGRWQSISFRTAGVRDIQAVKYRNNGDLWLGTERGLFLFKQSSSRWSYWKHPPPNLRNSVNEILHTKKGDFWLATSDGIVIRRPDGTTEEISQIGNTPLYVVTGLAEDPEGNIWISSGSSFTGTFRWNGSGWDHFPVSPESTGIFVHKIRTDRMGRLWFLGIGRSFPAESWRQAGAYVLENDRFLRRGEDHLPSGRVYSFAHGSDGALWFGTMAGLSRLKDSTWTHWTIANGLHSNRVFTMALDNNNTLWFGDYTENSGLGYIDGSDSVRYYTSADGLVNDMIWDIHVDDNGMVWTTTQGGIAAFDGKVWLTYDQKSGLEHLALWPVLPLEDAIYVGTIGDGVAILRRGESRTPDPVISIEKPIIEGQNVLVRWNALAFWGELDPPEIRTRYRLDDLEWSAWDYWREITFHDLPPGDHRIMVQARGMSGTFNSQGESTSFMVPLPFHLRPLFLVPTSTLAGLVLSMVIVLLYRKRRHDLALRKSEEKFRTVIETTASALFMYRGTTILFANAAAEALTGYDRSELLAMDLHDLIHPAHREMVRERESKGDDQTSNLDRYECQIVTKDGQERWVDFTTGWIRFEGMPVRLATALDIAERKKAESQLMQLASELSTTEERERRRMASYLHDVIGQTLAICKIKIRRLQKSPDAGSAGQSLEEIRQLVEQSIHNTQSLTFELCPPIVYELSLEAAVEWLTERLQQQHGIEFRFYDDKQPKPLGTDMRVMVFQAVREACMNAIKHADARLVAVSIRSIDGYVQIDVVDEGKGFDPAATSRPLAGGGFGLFNIRERLVHLGGSVTITSSPQAGTQVRIRAIPAAEASIAPA